jgi:hypothetical protein
MSNPPLAPGNQPLLEQPPSPGALPATRTLRLSAPSGQVLGPTLLLLLLLGAAEVIARLPAFQSQLSAPSLGGQQIYLEIQYHYLQAAVRRDGKPDCIVLGSSMVWLGFDPVAFSQAYRDQTGADLHCYNFGIDGMPASAAGAVAEILMQDFQPQLLIYGTDARDYAVPGDAPDATAILDLPWVRYRQGEFSVEGWLYAHSLLYGYRPRLRQLLRFDTRRALPRQLEYQVAQNQGFAPDDRVGAFVSSPPKPGDEQGQASYYFSLLSDYQMRAENLTGLEQVLSQASQAQVLVVVMPVADTYFDFFGEREHDYQLFLDEVGARAAHFGVPFWHSPDRQLTPLAGWLDYNHLNTHGAFLFSAWLGGQVAEAVLAGSLDDPTQ